MKAESTIKKRIRELRALIDDDHLDPVARRVAYEVECNLRWVTEDVVGWESATEGVVSMAAIIRQELDLEQL